MVISVRLDPELSEAFVALCERMRVQSRSALLRDLLQDWVLREQVKELGVDGEEADGG